MQVRMQPEEIQCDHPHEAVPFIIQRLGLKNIEPRLVRIEGTMLAGKSSLAHPLTEALGATRVAADCFEALRSEHGLGRYREALRNALSTHQRVVTDSVRLEEIAPEREFGCGYRVYVKRLRMLLGERGDHSDHAYSHRCRSALAPGP